jgi:[ribosomal protein S18]-alanine N-acetyltransferase
VDVVTVVLMNHEHVDAVRVIEVEASATPWSLATFTEIIDRETDGCGFVALTSTGEVIGFATLLMQAGDGHLTNIAVAPSHRRSGIARQLMHAIVDEAIARRMVALTLEVRASNRGAQRLYHQFGFMPVGVRPRYYQGEDAIIMWTQPLDSDDFRAKLAAV